MKKGEKNKNGNYRDNLYLIKTTMTAVCVIFILLLVYIIGTLFLAKDSFYPSGEKSQEEIFFSDCTLLREDCSESSCNFYSWCGGGYHEVCRIYDCESSYGVFTKDEDGEENMVKKDKPDLAAIDVQREACMGNIEIIEDECLDGEEFIKTRISTNGECIIDNFTLIYEDYGARPATFEDLGDGEYMITSNYCGLITRIAPSTEGGIPLELQ